MKFFYQSVFTCLFLIGANCAHAQNVELIKLSDNVSPSSIFDLNDRGEVVWVERSADGLLAELRYFNGNDIQTLVGSTDSYSSIRDIDLNDKGEVVFSAIESGASVLESFYFDTQSIRSLGNVQHARINNNSEIFWEGDIVQNQSNNIYKYTPLSDDLERLTQNNDYFGLLEINDVGGAIWRARNDSNWSVYDATDIKKLSAINSNGGPLFNNNGSVVWNTGRGAGSSAVNYYDGTSVRVLPFSQDPDIWFAAFALNDREQVALGGRVSQVDNFADYINTYLYKDGMAKQITDHTVRILDRDQQLNDLGQLMWLSLLSHDSPPLNDDGLAILADEVLFFYDGDDAIQITGRPGKIVNPLINNSGQMAWLGVDNRFEKAELFYLASTSNAVVPEPASVFLFSSGLAGLFLRRRKR